MEVMEAIQERRSVRAYKQREVEEKKLLRVMDAGRLSPSASNRQERRFIVVKDALTRKLLSEAARNQKFVAEAPVVIAACAAVDTDYMMMCGQLAYPIDTAIAVDHMTLQAVEEGLGTCWIGAFDEERVKQLLGIPGEVRVVSLLTLGYPSDVSRPKSRKSLDEVVMWEKWR